MSRLRLTGGVAGLLALSLPGFGVTLRIDSATGHLAIPFPPMVEKRSYSSTATHRCAGATTRGEIRGGPAAVCGSTARLRRRSMPQTAFHSCSAR
jgi:hypothetical protein